tara:strand:- start:1681 stop:3993 length:2313 start_codon:yes stop_codon:yes gene_type:complete
MGLTNKQKIALLRASRDNGYKGDLTKLFSEASEGGAFEKPAQPKPIMPDISLSDLQVSGSEAFKTNVKSLLVDKTPHRFNNNENFINRDHSVSPNPRAIISFLNDPEYRPTAEPNMGADGGMKKYHDGGYPHAHPHPEGGADGESQTVEPEVPETSELTVYNNLPSNVKYTYDVQEFLGVKPDGNMNEGTKKAILEYSNSNVNLADYNPNWKKNSIKCEGKSCSQQVTNVMQLMYPHLDKNDLVADDSWFRRDHMLRDGGQDIWSTNPDLDWDEVPETIPISMWNKLQVGDIVHLNSPGFRYKDKKSKYTGSTQGNDGSEHTGFIVGKDPETGMPLIMHGFSGKMGVDPLNNIGLGDEGHDYKVNGVTRPKKLIDKNDYNFDNLSMFLEKPDNSTQTQFAFDDDYLSGLSKDDRDMATFFTGFLNGNYPDMIDPRATVQTFDQAKAGEYSPHYVRNDEALLDEYRARQDYEERYNEDYFKHITPLQKISDITGYNEEMVNKAALMTWGFYQNETSDVGLNSGAQWSKINEYVKDNMSPKNAAKLKALKSRDFNWGNIFYDATVGSIPFVKNKGNYMNDEKYIHSAKQEASRGILRIKYEMNHTNADGSSSRVGEWWREYGLYDESFFIKEDDRENTLVTGKPGKQGAANSFSAGIMLTLNYYETIRRKPGYDPETETYKGIPIDYVVATMHKGRNLNQETGEGTVLENLRKGNRDYSNITIGGGNELSIRKRKISYGEEYEQKRNAGEETEVVIDEQTKVFQDSTDFINQ